MKIEYLSDLLEAVDKWMIAGCGYIMVFDEVEI
jgi:hypothetical protein